MSMVDYVIYTYDQTEYSLDSEQKMFEYANFLKQPISIGMFVPCDLDGNVLEELFKINYTSLKDTDCNCCDNSDYIYVDGNKTPYNNTLYSEDLRLYRQAKERCLFEGIEYVEAKHESSYSIIRVCKSLSTINYPKFWKNYTIEDLVKYKPKLTATALKQLGL